MTPLKQGANEIGAIVGPGRSGTTWAGTLVDSCPDVIYRFEPFHRLAKVDAEMNQWFQKLRNQEVREDDLPRIYTRLCVADPLTNKAPFFRNKSYPVRTFGRRQLWPVARLLRPARHLYSAVYTPRPGPPLVFKEVTFIKPLQNLLERTPVPVVYMVRHPCATVISSIDVQMREGIPARVQQLRATLQEQAPQLADAHADALDSNDLLRQAALLWRFEVDRCVTLARKSAHGLVMTYEQLADDTHSQSKAMFSHLGIEHGPHTLKFIDSLHSLRSTGRPGPRRTGWGNNRFSVYRNPKEQKDSWKKKVSAEDRRKVEEIVQGVPSLEYCAQLGAWW